VQSAAAQPAPKIDLAPAQDDIMDELLSSTTLPDADHISSAPLHPIGYRSSHDPDSVGMRLGKLAGLALGGAVAVVILIIALTYIWVNF
jgi:hypothetical protein